MTITSRFILRVSIALFVASMLFPPFIITLGPRHVGCGYGFLLSWPTYYDSTCRVDTGLLLMQWVFIAIAGFGSAHIVSKSGDAITINVPIRTLATRCGYVLLVIAMAFALGVIVNGYSFHQATLALMTYPMVASGMSVQGLVFIGAGYAVATGISRAGRMFTKRDQPFMAKLLVGFVIGAVVAMADPASQSSEKDVFGKKNQSSPASGGAFNDLIPAKKPWEMDWGNSSPDSQKK